MSSNANFWAWGVIRSTNIPFRGRLVLLALADRHNKSTELCCPGIATLASDTGLHRETVMESIKLLELEKVIFVERKLGAGSAYRFIGFNTNQSANIDQSVITDHLRTENQSTGNDQSVNTDPDQSTIADSYQSMITDSNQEIEPVNKTNMRKRANATLAPSAFSAFYDAYPKKKARQKAESAWKKLNPDEVLFAEIMTGLDRAKKSRDWLKDGGQYIPYPATWLNHRRWEDDDQPMAGMQSLTESFLDIGGLV